MVDADRPVAEPSRVGEVHDEMEFVEELPKLKRTGNTNVTPRQAFPWELALQPAREKVGQWGKIITFGEGEKKAASAKAKAQSIANYMFAQAPEEAWTVRARELDSIWAVYVKYDGPLSETAMAERLALHKKRSDRIKAARAV